MKKNKDKKWRKSLLKTQYVHLMLFQGLETARKYIQQFDVDILHTSAMQYA
jgi:hypothetical protein